LRTYSPQFSPWKIYIFLAPAAGFCPFRTKSIYKLSSCPTTALLPCCPTALLLCCPAALLLPYYYPTAALLLPCYCPTTTLLLPTTATAATTATLSRSNTSRYIILVVIASPSYGSNSESLLISVTLNSVIYNCL